jgi:hypothetical protein
MTARGFNLQSDNLHGTERIDWLERNFSTIPQPGIVGVVRDTNSPATGNAKAVAGESPGPWRLCVSFASEFSGGTTLTIH